MEKIRLKASREVGENQQNNVEKTSGERKASGMMPPAPEGYKTVEIETGVSGEEFTEVKSGLSEGDLIYSQNVSSSGNSNMFGRMPGGMSGGMTGGMTGGMSGGMPPHGMSGGMSGGMGGR